MSRPAALAASASQRTPATAAPPDTADLAAARKLVKALDTYYLDPIIGAFVPGLGDIITSIVGMFVIGVAARRGVPPIVIARMLLNLGIDAAVGVIPLAGDVADVAVRANKKNLALLEDRTARPDTTWKDWAAVIGAGVVCLGAISLVVYLFVRLLGYVF